METTTDSPAMMEREGVEISERAGKGAARFNAMEVGMERAPLVLSTRPK
jgi:hypothetical protein